MGNHVALAMPGVVDMAWSGDGGGSSGILTHSLFFLGARVRYEPNFAFLCPLKRARHSASAVGRLDLINMIAKLAPPAIVGAASGACDTAVLWQVTGNLNMMFILC